MKKEDSVLERIKRTSNNFEKEVAMLKWRWVGSVIIIVVLIVALVIVSGRSNYLIIDTRGGVYTSTKVDRTDPNVLLIEAEAHMAKFYNSAWTFDHNNIEQQQRKASYLGGKVVTDLYKTLTENGFYGEVRRNGYYVSSTIDSVDVSGFRFSNGVLQMQVYGTMQLRNNDFIQKRHLDMNVSIVLVDRILERNPNGMSIEVLTITSNETIK